ncbi:MAG: hypothetical protein HUU50_21290 [Candidatus Brocadiae bacterium]|nr:hypothetical protein [Candidatus Brocadiia bacterium]
MKIALCFLLYFVYFCGQMEGQESATSDITGIWQQYIEWNNQWIYLSTFEVKKENGVYSMTAVHFTSDIPIIPSLGISQIRFNGKTWTFLSDWGKENGGKAFFKLNKYKPNMFLGYSYLNGRKISHNFWLRPEL